MAPEEKLILQTQTHVFEMLLAELPLSLGPGEECCAPCCSLPATPPPLPFRTLPPWWAGLEHCLPLVWHHALYLAAETHCQRSDRVPLPAPTSTCTR